MQLLRTSDADFEVKFAKLVRDRRESDMQVGRDVAGILNEVRERGDKALVEYTKRFDQHNLSSEDDWSISKEACKAAWKRLPHVFAPITKAKFPRIATTPTISACASVRAGALSKQPASTYPVAGRPTLPRC